MEFPQASAGYDGATLRRWKRRGKKGKRRDGRERKERKRREKYPRNNFLTKALQLIDSQRIRDVATTASFTRNVTKPNARKSIQNNMICLLVGGFRERRQLWYMKTVRDWPTSAVRHLPTSTTNGMHCVPAKVRKCSIDQFGSLRRIDSRRKTTRKDTTAQIDIGTVGQCIN